MGSTKIDAAENFASTQIKRTWFYVGTLNINLLKHLKKIENYIFTQFPGIGDLVVDKLNSSGTNMSFKVGIGFKYRDQASKDDFWSSGIVFKRFKFKPNDILGMNLMRNNITT